MEKATLDSVDSKEGTEVSGANISPAQNETPPASEKKPDPRKPSCKKHRTKKTKQPAPKKTKQKAKKKLAVEETSDSSGTSSTSSDSEDETESETESSEPDTSKSKARAKKSKSKSRKKSSRAKEKKARKAKKRNSSDDESSDTEEEESDDEPVTAKSVKDARAKALLRAKRQLKQDQLDEDDLDSDEEPDVSRYRSMQAQIKRMGQPVQRDGRGRGRGGRQPIIYDRTAYYDQRLLDGLDAARLKKKAAAKKKKRASKVAYKRVDQLWDQSIHNYKLTETIPDPDVNEWDQYIFTVRRRFDWEHKYLETQVDIKSALLKECLQHVMADVKGVNLVSDKPAIDPNMLFLYLEECRGYQKRLADEGETAKKKKVRRQTATKAQHLKILVKYLDKDYAETKKTLYPMLENNTITFELLWALYKPNTIAYTSTYGDNDHPRAFKIDYAVKESAFMKGTWYSVEGKYLDYDGKSFGMGSMTAEVSSFQGARKISSLDCYPIQYNKDAAGLKTRLIERGKKFVALKGVNYRCHNGMAFTKRKRQVLKININGRVMVDPAIHRRINPNYPISTVKPKDDQDVIDVDESDEGCGGCTDSDCSESELGDLNTPSSSEDGPDERRKKYRVVKDENGEYQVAEIDSEDNNESPVQKAKLADRKGDLGEAFSDEELLIASPVVLGFAFGDKLWLEFTVSGISDVVWNEGAFESLVLPEGQKSIVKALVSSHVFHASKSIDDIISGKGKGLVAVLHGPPGTGKTLTAEGIADYLKRPLYMVSSGDLGTDARNLERELQNVLDIAHAWGAILLLDEADIFLERRSLHDIHRNAMVSIFLKALEYYQGLLFLTTNRVETFDEAFVSRIHLSLRYGELTVKARKSIWQMFINKVQQSEGTEVDTFSDGDFNELARRNVNGRQIKNLTRTAQALAMHEDKALTMAHVRRVIEVAESFEMDLKGGTGYMDAMRGYT